MKDLLTRSHRLLALALALPLLLTYGCTKPTVNEFNPPEPTQWAPQGTRLAGSEITAPNTPPTFFRTMHGNINNTDNLWIAAAPMTELAWVAEPEFYIPEGPTYDRSGNLYISPLSPQEDVSLVAIDATTGERQWSIPGEGRNAGSGAILVLADPDSPADDIIYHTTYAHAMALTPEGTELWKTPTGLTITPLEEGEREHTHTFGMNYHAPTDSVIGVTFDGYVFAMDRASGQSRNALFQLPGSTTPPSSERPADWIINIGNKETDKTFGKIPGGTSYFEALVDIIFGGAGEVTNFYGVDPNTGRIYIAATAPDAEDGIEDGISDFGAIYQLDLTETNGNYQFEIINYRSFAGGTGSTPSISPDSSRVVVSDAGNNVIVFDADLNELWRLDVGDQIAASVAISPDNNELYVVTKNDIIKIVDLGTSGVIEWKANLNAWSTDVEFNALTPTIIANGIVVSIGSGYELQGQQIMLGVGMGLIDRETGNIRYFAEGREESIAISSVGPNGGIYTANSPVRRAVGRGLLPNITAPLTGGVSYYKPIRLDLLARDAVCASAARVDNLLSYFPLFPSSTRDELQQIKVLISQAQQALTMAVADGDLTANIASGLTAELTTANAQLNSEPLNSSNLVSAVTNLNSVCQSL